MLGTASAVMAAGRRPCHDPGVDDVCQDPVRIDRWLWAARLVKTRSLAAEAVKGGRVAVNGQRIKPSKDVRPGDRVEVTLGQVRLAVVVRGTAVRRGPAAEAARLYEETAESREARERLAAERRMAAMPTGDRGGRPTKRDRRRLEATDGFRRRRP
jgi:ribosome-associated heat shock protein Hsp15